MAGEDLVYIAAPPRAPAERPPLLVLLHGVGSNEEDLIGLAPGLDPRFYLVSLRGPLTLGPGSYAWFHVLFTPQGPSHDSDEAEASRRLLIEAVPELVAATETDPRRVFFLGFSQGAIMSLYTGLSRPDLLAGIVAMSGRVLPEVQDHLADAAALEGLPILLMHGTQDAVLPVHHGREARDFLQTLPVALTYREYPMGHEVSRESLAAANAWLGAQLARLAEAPPEAETS